MRTHTNNVDKRVLELDTSLSDARQSLSTREEAYKTLAAKSEKQIEELSQTETCRAKLEEVVRTVLHRQAPLARAALMLMQQNGSQEATGADRVTPGGMLLEEPKRVTGEMRRLVSELHELTVEGISLSGIPPEGQSLHGSGKSYAAVHMDLVQVP